MYFFFLNNNAFLFFLHANLMVYMDFKMLHTELLRAINFCDVCACCTHLKTSYTRYLLTHDKHD